MDNCKCGYCPTVIVPGIGHSRVELLNDAGKSLGYVFPPEIDAEKLIRQVAPIVAKMCLLHKTDKYVPALKKVIGSAVDGLSVNCEGLPVYPQKVERYDYPFSEFPLDFKKYIYRCIPVQDLSDVIDESHMFFYSFNSFGQPYEAAEGLNSFIQYVKKVTGHDKVNLLVISLGGCVSVAYLDSYAHKGDVHRIVNFVPAINGTSFVADIIDRNLDLSDPMGLLELFVGHRDAVSATAALKKLPEKVYYAIMQAIIDVAREKIVLNCANMWATVPKERYVELRDKYLTGSKYAILRAKADRLHRAHINYENNVETARQTGTQFFNICGYGLPLISLSRTNTVSSDGVIDLYGTSAFAHSAPLGSTLPDGYRQRNLHCSGHEHISPDRTVDASAGLFPDTTWYFRNQFHDAMGFNDAALLTCREILTNDSFTDVFSDPRFPQFNGSRNTHHLRRSLLPQAAALDRTMLSPDTAKLLNDAVANAAELLGCTVIDENGAQKADEITSRLGDAVRTAQQELQQK